MRRVISVFVVALVAAGCGDIRSDAPAPAAPPLLIRQSPSPFQHVSAGPVSATIPDEWRTQLAGSSGDPRRGIVAGPRLTAWQGDRPPIEGLAAMWVDGTEVGVPSDYYYLAATSTALHLITGSKRCSATSHRVIVDHVPTYARGTLDSPGDFVARGIGTCTVRDRLTRWAYFVAAPGYGPVREVGIPSSGLYLVVAAMPESPRAPLLLDRLLERTEFNGASVAEMIAAARPPTFTVVGPV
ncbi:MAG TPA: hypothetical protein VFK59_01805 [Actinomycetota bacterium]|nr:hypothetical protein [Actinomycetota bacterium]